MSTAPVDTQEETLLFWLEDFKRRFNSNPRASKLTTGWDRRLQLDATDTGAQFIVTVEGAQITGIAAGRVNRDEDQTLVELSAEEATLMDIFCGEYNPSTALIDGQLEVYSDARDKVKLEALAMVIWGV